MPPIRMTALAAQRPILINLVAAIADLNQGNRQAAIARFESLASDPLAQEAIASLLESLAAPVEDDGAGNEGELSGDEGEPNGDDGEPKEPKEDPNAPLPDVDWENMVQTDYRDVTIATVPECTDGGMDPHEDEPVQSGDTVGEAFDGGEVKAAPVEVEEDLPEVPDTGIEVEEVTE